MGNKRTQVYLHVGMPKCASSTIQGYLNKYDYRNYPRGFCYPSNGRSDGGYFNHEPLTKLSPEEIPAYIQLIKKEAKNSDVIFISAEEFVNSKWDSPITKAWIHTLNNEFGADNVNILWV